MSMQKSSRAWANMLREDQPFEVPSTAKPKFPVRYPKKGCWSRTPQKGGTLREGAIGRELTFEELDKNGDGVVSREEYEEAMRMKVPSRVLSDVRRLHRKKLS